jgi:hypothetical protein
MKSHHRNLVPIQEGEVMTETEWLVCTDPISMLELLEGKASNRKLQLFSVACLRRIWDLISDGRSRKLVEITEHFLDGTASTEEACSAYDAFNEPYQQGAIHDAAGGSTHEAVESVAHEGAGAAMLVALKASEAIGYATALSIHASSDVSSTDWSPARTEAWRSAQRREWAVQAALLRDIIGPLLFRSQLIKSNRLLREEDRIPALAQAIYDNRAFDQLPILANALEQAGCKEADVLDHCRSGGEHVRGCWVVDLILNKE